mmetsp:Transcript_504/g.1161  ORF Transcript_504/g.1161 Transcript_504/m.1161 type:complete len:163 (-) Transcript_504:791-1279(-)
MTSTVRRVCKRSCDFKTYLDSNIGEECPCCNGGCGEDYSGGMDSVSLLRFLAGLLQIEIKYALTKECMQDILDWVRSGLRGYDRNIVPSSVYTCSDRLWTCRHWIGSNTTNIFVDIFTRMLCVLEEESEHGHEMWRTRFKRIESPKPRQNFHLFGVEESIRS